MKKTVKRKLPKGWEWRKLYGKDGIADIVNGSTPSTDFPKYWDGDILWATPSDIGKLNSIYIENTERKITDAGLQSCSTKLLPIGTVLLTSRAPVGNIAIAKKPICTNQGFKSFVPKKGIDSLLLYFAIKKIVPEIQKQSHGNTFVEITKELLKGFVIPFPKEEKIQSEVASRLENKTNVVEKMRQSALKQKDAISAMHDAILRDAIPFKNNDKLPQGWKWMKIGDVVTDLQYGLSNELNLNGKGFKIFRMNEIIDGKMADSDNMKHVDVTSNDFERYKLYKGDILFNRTNSYELVGKTGIFDLEGDYCFASYLIRLKVNRDIVEPDYINLIMNSALFQKNVKRVATRSVSQANVNTINLRKILIPVPDSTDLQRKIVNKCQNNLTHLRYIKKNVDMKFEAIEALRSAILREVFDFQEVSN